jgi:hypothetical protein
VERQLYSHRRQRQALAHRPPAATAPAAIASAGPYIGHLRRQAQKAPSLCIISPSIDTPSATVSKPGPAETARCSCRNESPCRHAERHRQVQQARACLLHPGPGTQGRTLFWTDARSWAGPTLEGCWPKRVRLDLGWAYNTQLFLQVCGGWGLNGRRLSAARSYLHWLLSFVLRFGPRQPCFRG